MPSMAPAASKRCPPWHGIGSFHCAAPFPYILSRNAHSNSAGGDAFTCRLSPFAGGSSWQCLIAPPITDADPKHRLRSAATATRGRLAVPFVAAVLFDWSYSRGEPARCRIVF